jgi:hypothetical protein
MRIRWRGPAGLLAFGAALLASVVGVTVDPGRGQGAASRVDETVEPPMKFTLEVGDSRHVIEIGKPLSLETEEGKTVVVLRADDHRVFPYGGVRFRYPAHFSFEADLETPGAHIWSLDGTDVVLMVQRFPGRTDHEVCRREVARATASQLGIRRPRTSETKRKLGGREVPGTRLDVAIGVTRLTMDFYSLVVGRATVLIVVQDGLGDDGGQTDEWESTLEMLADSFEVTR